MRKVQSLTVHTYRIIYPHNWRHSFKTNTLGVPSFLHFQVLLIKMFIVQIWFKLRGYKCSFYRVLQTKSRHSWLCYQNKIVRNNGIPCYLNNFLTLEEHWNSAFTSKPDSFSWLLPCTLNRWKGGKGAGGQERRKGSIIWKPKTMRVKRAQIQSSKIIWKFGSCTQYYHTIQNCCMLYKSRFKVSFTKISHYLEFI